MPITTDLSPAPYHMEHDSAKNYHGVLFKPSVSVQTRELNEMQEIFQEQIERFADNIFKRGTIVSGCNFNFFPSYPYAKLQDTDLDGFTAAPAVYKGYFAKNQANLQAFIINYEDGFESTTPDLKTIYLNYINAGNDFNTNSFSAGETLTIYDPLIRVFSVDVNGGGINFSNTDQLVVTSALLVNVSTGTFAQGTNVYTDTATMLIANVDTLSYASSGQVVLKVRPRTSELTNVDANSTSWTIANNESIRNADNTAVATVEAIIGGGADGIITTDAAGRVIEVTMTENGQGYDVLPYVTVKSSNNSTGIGTLDLTARNYLAKVRVASGGDSIGNGYAFGISNGLIYQVGRMIRVDEQIVIVDKYTQSPNAVSVGFTTHEELIDSNIDTDLLDNATGEPNETAPGADRLKLTPELIVLDSEVAKANADFFTLVEWSEGNPFKQNRTTEYNVIGDEMARARDEQSGDYVLDKFLVTTRSPANSAYEGNTVSVVVDPGTAYIDGYRIQTTSNFVIDIDKGIDTKISNNQYVSLNYGNYIRVKEVGGAFLFSTGDTIKLYNTAKQFVTNTAAAIAGNVTPVGTEIGTARIRSMNLEDGVPGTSNAIYRLAVFNVTMNSGKNFRDVRSVVYDGTSFDGIADVVLEPDATTSSNVAALRGTLYDRLLFSTGVGSLKNANNTNYTYRTLDVTVATGNNGLITKSIAATPNEFFPYSGALSDAQLKTLYVVPTGNNLVAYANATGTVASNNTIANLVGTSTTFLSDFVAGDYVYLYGNSTTSDIKKVLTVVNNTMMAVDSNCSFSNSVSRIYRAFPKNVPVPFGSRVGLSANVDSNGNILTVNFGMTFAATTSTNSALGVNIERRDITQTAKTANRDAFVRIRLANNVAGAAGPWCLGIPDIFRLKGVYVGNSTVNTTSGAVATSDFYIDHNQTPNYYDLGYLYLKPQHSITLNASTDYILVKFDYFTSSGAGFYDTVSYVSANGAQIANVDSTPLANLTTQVNTLEIPELYTTKGEYYDLMNQFDFRPYVVNTVAAAVDSTLAPINPAYTVSFGTTTDPSNDKKFPLPDSTLSTSVEEYLPRVDSVFLSKDGIITVAKGSPSADPSERYAPNVPDHTMVLNDLDIPAYPTIPNTPSVQLSKILATGMANERYAVQRMRDHTVMLPFSTRDIENEQPAVYTMRDIGALDRRLSDVEYYTSLSLLEGEITRRVVPSSVNPTLDRFKFGFFVDDYNTAEFSEVTSPWYAAAIEDNDVVPSREIWTIEHPGHHSCPYIDWEIVSQSNATKGAPLTTNCVPSTTVANNLIVRKQLDPKDRGNTKVIIDTITLTMANVAANATLYFHNYSAHDRIDIYQGNSVIKTTANAVQLSTADKTFLKSNAIPSAWFKDITFVNFSNAAQQYAKFSGKIQWVHTPALGKNYTVKVTKGSGSVVWRYMLEYPVDNTVITCPTTPNTSSPTSYNGTMIVTPSTWQYTWE